MRNSLLILCLFFFWEASGQDSKPEELVQELLQEQEEATEHEDAYETLLHYYANPLDINKAAVEDLQQLYLLSPLQIHHFIKYRNEAGPLLSVYELQTVPTWDIVTIRKLLPFIKIGTPTSGAFPDMFRGNSNHYLLLRYGRTIESSIPSSLHGGDANKYYTRYKNSKPGQFSYGLTLEKDAGEKIYWNSAQRYYGMDYVSGHFALFNKGKVKTFSLGDYQLQFGQGLVVSSGFRLGKGAESILSIKKSNAGIRPYSSTLEYGFFRGAAITAASGPAEFSLFYSNKFIDGSLKEDGSFSPVTTGYHRTSSELNRRGNIQEQMMGTNISFHNSSKKFHSGITFAKMIYNYSLKKTPSLYNAFEFSGKRNYTAGADFSYTHQNFIFFGESAISESGGKGLISGFMASLSKQIETAMVYRNYARNFHSLYSNAFGESVQNFNEKGIYWGVKIKPSYKWVFSCYYDHFRFPWLKYLTDAPSGGEEYLARLSYFPSKTSFLYIQYRQKNKEKNKTDNSSPLDQLIPSAKKNFLFHVEVKASANLSTRTRIQYSTFQQNFLKSSGYAIMNELDLNLHPLSLSFRYTLFDTDDFENRQYMYERDVLYSFSIPAYQGKGTRSYVILKVKLLRNIDSWIKYSRTVYIEKEKITESAAKNNFSDIKIQLRYSFR